MNTKFACCLITLLGVFALQPAAHAQHLTQIEQLVGSVNGDTTAQAIQLRMRVNGQTMYSLGKLVVVDAAGLNPITVLDLASDVPNGTVGARVLIASANFPSHTTPPAVPDFTIANLIPASYLAAGSLTWENDSGSAIWWRLSWGGAAYTGPNSGRTFNDMDGNFGPPYGGPLPTSCSTVLQFQGAATDFSTNNAADYRLSPEQAENFVNNAGASFHVVVPLTTVTITAPDSSASEVPASDTGRFRVTRAGCTDSNLIVFYTISGTASNRTDYQTLNGRATIRSGTTSATITVRPIDDAIPEPDETVILTLSPRPTYMIGSPNTATITIHSNE